MQGHRPRSMGLPQHAGIPLQARLMCVHVQKAVAKAIQGKFGWPNPVSGLIHWGEVTGATKTLGAAKEEWQRLLVGVCKA